ncbi:phospho-N-acetylmuramoyl-pentapeptide-transferase [Cutibacterium acnes JCM 18916]|nr:phospho-N-acetylmuramoyl-pentapeptide-transferase [Cutibacterium acnes JCM 18916]GAE75514.1 phospho-N-acetylmuramoyl-pentapeptide-transferase [Cutibacterium acnes JCM 18918]
MKNILLAGAVSMIGTLVARGGSSIGSPRRAMASSFATTARQPIRRKKGTPTMGGAVIIVSVLLAYLVAHLVTWTSLHLGAAGVVAVFGIGFHRFS